MAEKRGELLSKSWKYLADNFHKFSEDKRIQISLELCKKDLPNKIEGELKDIKIVVIPTPGDK